MHFAQKCILQKVYICGMKTLLLCLLLAANQPADSIKVLFWNVENFFDWRNDSTSVSDAEFSSQGARRWTRKRFAAKCNAIAKAILWAGVPDVIGLAEVENARVLKRLLQETALRKLDYRIVHFDSPDTLRRRLHRPRHAGHSSRAATNIGRERNCLSGEPPSLEVRRSGGLGAPAEDGAHAAEAAGRFPAGRWSPADPRHG